jgi:hypothetical protein
VKRVAVVVASVLLLAACGGSSGGANAKATAQIKSAYTKFFSPKTSLQGRVALLQDGSRFEPVIRSFASNPAAKQVTVTVSSVTLQGANKAKVVYTVKLAPLSLPKQTGTAVKQNGKWKIGYQSLCNLVALGGSPPPQCTK